MDEGRYIAVEGPIGVGKTSLVDRLAIIFNARKVLEGSETNPFLVDFYNEPGSYAFQTQLFFLLSRYKQQLEMAQFELFNKVTICDYIFPKDRLFASVNLTDDEFRLYDEIYSLLEIKVLRPDIVVYLQANVDILLKRIRKRKRGIEKNIDFEYLEEINEAYNYFFFNYSETPLLVIDTNEIDFVESDLDFREIVKMICKTHKGVEFYKPLGS